MNTNILIILEVAQNHMGDVQHGLNTINEFSKVASKFRYNFNFAFKFQLRDLDTFIHPDFKDRKDLKYVKRFQECKLTDEEFEILKKEVEKYQFKTICTAFDEPSVDKIVAMKFDYIKVASCSCTDWPLLNKIAEVNLPIIISTAGTSYEDLDKVVEFFTHRKKIFSLMHCVGQYPTPSYSLKLNRIDELKKRYPRIQIGFSTHEDVWDMTPSAMAVAKGVEIFERHIGLETDKYTINNYSSTPEQIFKWLNSINDAHIACSTIMPNRKEQEDLNQFRRGVFVKEDVRTGDEIDKSKIFYAFPALPTQILANDMSKYTRLIVKQDIKKNGPVMGGNVNQIEVRKEVWEIVQKVKKFILGSGVVFPKEATLELSHHYGIEKFYDTGISMITVVNKDYCKKLIVVLPGQINPYHYHKIKDETFFILHGSLKIIKMYPTKAESGILNKGDLLNIPPGVKHEFSTDEGCVMEELSTKHYPNDSFYIDDLINENKNRKTIVQYWL